MKNSTILRTAKVGGFNKEDVLTYVDELNAKIDSLKADLEKAQDSAVNPAELEEYKSEIVRLTQLVNDNEKGAENVLVKLKEIFGEDLYVELQDHNLPEQAKNNEPSLLLDKITEALTACIQVL